MNYKQLTFAREYRNCSQTELASAVKGLSQSNLSKFEKGFDVLSDEVKNKIIEYLNFPASFFNRRINASIENTNYRKKSAISKTDIQQFENKCKLIGLIVDEFSESIDWPAFTFTPINVEKGFTPQYIANYTRRHLGLASDEPVKNIYNLLEKNGIIVYEMDINEKFDGVSFISDKGYPIIILNKNFSNDRKRFTLAHELGHVLMHNENYFPISSIRVKEDEANIYASEFLMPEKEIKNSLRGIRMSDLASLKSHWLTSMASIIRKAKDLKCIDANRYKFFLIEMSRYGYNRNEPMEPYIDRPTCFKNAVNIFRDNLSYSLKDFMNFTSLPEDVINDLLSLSNVIKFNPLKATLN